MILFDDQFIIDIIVGFILLASLFLILILYIRYSYVIDRKWKKTITEICQTILANYVNESDPKEIKRIHSRILKIFNTKEKRQILLDQVIDLNSNFSGKISRTIHQLYTEMKLHNLSIQKINDRRWWKKIEGMVEVSKMNYEKGFDLIEPLLIHENVNVRRQAKISLVELRKIEGIKLLENYPTPMSEWTYISILSIMHRHPMKISQTDLIELKSSSNEHVKSLANHLEKHSVVYK